MVVYQGVYGVCSLPMVVCPGCVRGVYASLCVYNGVYEAQRARLPPCVLLTVIMRRREPACLPVLQTVIMRRREPAWAHSRV